MLVRSRSLHPLDTSPLFPQLTSVQWHSESIAPCTGPFNQPFPGSAVFFGHEQPEMRFGPPPQYNAYSPMHFLPGSFASHSPRAVHRSHSEYGGLRSHMRGSPSLMYYSGGRDPRRPPSHLPGYDPSDMVLHTPPLMRQRTSKACEKCRLRKTRVCNVCQTSVIVELMRHQQCSGEHPCSRCSNRGFDCTYLDKAESKGPKRARRETRRRLAAKTVSFEETSSDESRSEGSSHGTPTDKKSEASGSSDTTERIPSVMRPSSLPSLRVQTSLPAAPVGPAPAVNPGYMPYVVSSPTLIDGSLHQDAEMTDDQAASMIQGYTVPWNQECAARTHAHANGIWGQQRTADSDASDSPRPGSSCSASSFCSSETSGYSQSSDASVRYSPRCIASSPCADRSINTSVHSMVWPSPMVDFAFSTPGYAPPLSATSSTSSLDGALVEKPVRAATLPTSSAQTPAHAPIATGGTDLTTVLTDILSQSHISETATETANGHGLSIPSPAIDVPPSPSFSDWSLVNSPVIGALRFEDVFDLSTASSNITIRGGPSFASGLGASPSFDGQFAYMASAGSV